MCGIVGSVAARNVIPILIEGLKRLEYRGYDSAGVSLYLEAKGELTRVRRVGKVKALDDALVELSLSSRIGIAHTRWATHGAPSERNAHPHMSGEDIAVVHNGIIENYEVLKKELITEGFEFYSDTDTEVIAHLVQYYFNQSKDLLLAVRQSMARLEGAYAIGVVSRHFPDKLIAGRKGSPLVIGLGVGENFIASDTLALLFVTNRFIYMEEGDIAEITSARVDIFNIKGDLVKRAIHESDLTHDVIERGEFRHYMLKEIYEQPSAIRRTLEGRIDDSSVLMSSFGALAVDLFSRVQSVQIVACGTSYHAGSVARYWFEEIAGLPCNVEIASEYRYRKTVTPANALLVVISQSGETADTLAALKDSKNSGFVASLAVCNVPGSSLVREADLCIMTNAGPEIGVASTKAFTTQLTALFLLMIALGKSRGNVSVDRECALVSSLRQLPGLVEAALGLSSTVESLAKDFGSKHHALFLGRGAQYPVAMEGALKLKEISYIHAEAYAAGELKHGPLALVDADMPVIAVAPNNQLLEKLKSNLQEVRARGGELYVFADRAAHIEPSDGLTVINVPSVCNELAPILFTIPLQLLSYYVALIKGTDVDQPRNLAKSVTVE